MNKIWILVEWPSLEVLMPFDTAKGALDYVENMTAPLHIFEYDVNSRQRRSIWNYELSEAQLSVYDSIYSYKYVKTTPVQLGQALQILLKASDDTTPEQLAGRLGKSVKWVKFHLGLVSENNSSPIIVKGASETVMLNAKPLVGPDRDF